MNGTYFIRHGNVYVPADAGAQDRVEVLPGGVFVLKLHPMQGFFFEAVPLFEIPGKLYGRHAADAERILSTFERRPGSTGVVLAGDKGTGKTLVAKIAANDAAKYGIPTILINECYVGDAFNSLLASLQQPAIFFLDEFEKVYDKDKQPHLLTLLDGVFGGGRRLFLMTTNDKWKVDIHMQNRPGRIYYLLEYQGVETEFIREYCEDRLHNKAHIEGVCLLGTVFSEFNFDMLQAIVEEMNRYKEDAMQTLRWLNCKMTFAKEDVYAATLTVKGKVYAGNQLYNRGRWIGTPAVANDIEMYYPEDGSKWGEKSDVETVEVRFSKHDLVRMDVKKGEYVFRNTDDAQLTLKRDKRPQGFDLNSFVDQYGTSVSVAY